MCRIYCSRCGGSTGYSALPSSADAVPERSCICHTLPPETKAAYFERTVRVSRDAHVLVELGASFGAFTVSELVAMIGTAPLRKFLRVRCHDTAALLQDLRALASGTVLPVQELVLYESADDDARFAELVTRLDALCPALLSFDVMQMARLGPLTAAAMAALLKRVRRGVIGRST